MRRMGYFFLGATDKDNLEARRHAPPPTRTVCVESERAANKWRDKPRKPFCQENPDADSVGLLAAHVCTAGNTSQGRASGGSAARNLVFSRILLGDLNRCRCLPSSRASRTSRSRIGRIGPRPP